MEEHFPLMPPLHYPIPSLDVYEHLHYLLSRVWKTSSRRLEKCLTLSIWPCWWSTAKIFYRFHNKLPQKYLIVVQTIQVYKLHLNNLYGRYGQDEKKTCNCHWPKFLHDFHMKSCQISKEMHIFQCHCPFFPHLLYFQCILSVGFPAVC